MGEWCRKKKKKRDACRRESRVHILHRAYVAMNVARPCQLQREYGGRVYGAKIIGCLCSGRSKDQRLVLPYFETATLLCWKEYALKSLEGWSCVGCSYVLVTDSATTTSMRSIGLDAEMSVRRDLIHPVRSMKNIVQQTGRLAIG